MKKFVFQIILLFTLSQLFGAPKGHLVGNIKTESGENLSGAAIRLLNTGIGTSSNHAGFYSLEGVPIGKYQIEVTYLGYETQVRSIKIDENSICDFVLQSKTMLVNDITVSATRAGSNAPFAYTNIGNKTLNELKNGEEIPFLLSLTPSLVSLSENGTSLGNTSFRIRGSDPSRINVTVDGVPLNDAESQTVFWVNMSDFSESVQDIQLQRGVGSSTNGAGAFGASLNLKTITFDSIPYSTFSSTAGSFNTIKNSISINTGLMKNHFAFDARFSKVNSDGYIKHTALDHKSYYLSGGYYTDKTTIRAVIWSNEEHTGISWWGLPSDSLKTNRRFNPAGVYLDPNNVEHYFDTRDNYVQTHFRIHFSQEINQNLRLNSALFYTKGIGYYEEYQDDANWMNTSDFASYGLPNLHYLSSATDTISNSDIIRRKWLDNDFYGATFSLEYRSAKTELILGGGANQYNGNHFGQIMWAEFNPGIPYKYEYYKSNSLKNDANIFAKATYNITAKLLAYADLQYRYIDYTMKGLTSHLDPISMYEKYSFFNPKAGIFYKNGNSQIYVSFGIAHREPTGENLENSVGDLAAKPISESLYDTELGYNFRSSKFAYGANIYFMNYTNQLVPTGEKSDVGYDIMTNVPKSYRTGVELMASWMPVSSILVEANSTFSRNKVKNFVEYLTFYDENYNVLDYKGVQRGNTNLAFSPEIVASGKITYKPTRFFDFSFITKYVGNQYFDNTSERDAMLKHYLVSDLAVSLHPILPFIKQTDLKLKINNIFGTDYISNAYGGKDMVNNQSARWTYYFPQAFTNFMIQLNIKF